jgi:integrase
VEVAREVDSDLVAERLAREFAMTAALRTLLEGGLALSKDYKKRGKVVRLAKADGHVFTKKNRAAIGSFRKRWHAACRAAGIPDRVAMTMTGHLTRSVFDRYHIVSKRDQREAARRLDALDERTVTGA